MGKRTPIGWCDDTFNPWMGCQSVSPGCDNCYAEALVKRYGHADWGPHAERKRTAASTWAQPIRWNLASRLSKRPALVFCSSLADVFDNKAPPGALDDLWRLIEKTPWLVWLLLTKRPQRIKQSLPGNWHRPANRFIGKSGDGVPHNVWLGISAENQTEYDRRWPILADIPCRRRFVSYEPALGPLDILKFQTRPDWLIWGGESGPDSRPMQAKWALDITSQCERASIPVFGKQWGAYENNPLTYSHGLVTAKSFDSPEHGHGGAMLKGKLWRQFPPLIRSSAESSNGWFYNDYVSPTPPPDWWDADYVIKSEQVREKRRLMIAIKPEYFKFIATGQKQWEFRRAIWAPAERYARYALVYQSAPVSAVTHKIYFTDIIISDPGELWSHFGRGGGISKRAFDRYFAGRAIGYALKIAGVVPLSTSKTFQITRPLSDFGIVTPPQNFRYHPRKKYAWEEVPTPT